LEVQCLVQGVEDVGVVEEDVFGEANGLVGGQVALVDVVGEKLKVVSILFKLKWAFRGHINRPSGIMARGIE
jgi:hypothetical protein